ncbi:VOC family protein [Paenibacillus alkalitolerans]|uniref:VOC family protein n=1 Tax=Paenibacillus alkalitolerans TaxID=2799335 RepID=UPI0018F2FE36|nr:VOC family protein [Paenibacillus alkalitolerans]
MSGMEYIKAREVVLGIPVEDYEGSIQWYVNVLGCELIFKMGIAQLRLPSGQKVLLYKPENDDQFTDNTCTAEKIYQPEHPAAYGVICVLIIFPPILTRNVDGSLKRMLTLPYDIISKRSFII